MLKKRRFLAVNSSISGGAGSKLQSETCTVSFGNQSGMQKWLFIASHCEQEYNYLKITKRVSLLQVDSRELENADGHLFHACRREFTRPGLKQGCFVPPK